MKTILRNFFSVLRRFSLAAFLNVAGWLLLLQPLSLL